MTYSEFIAMVSREVLDRRAWPNDGTKLQEQVDLSYVAGLSVACELPLSKLPLIETALSGAVVAGTTVYKHPFPATVFSDREDLGVQNILLNDQPKVPDQFLSVSSVFKSASNQFQSTEPLIAVDLPGRVAYTVGSQTVKIRHFLQPVKPATGSVGATTYFLPDKDAQRAVHIVASHISGARIRDNAGATFQSMLEQYYAKT